MGKSTMQQSLRAKRCTLGRAGLMHPNEPGREERPKGRRLDSSGESPTYVEGTPGPGEQAGLPPGAIVDKRYTIRARLGAGGMGVVYRAYDSVLDTEVALKFLSSTGPQNERQRERFLGEARAAREISHPNIVRVHDAGLWEGAPYISMEYVRGRTLAQEIEHRRSRGEKPKPQFALETILQVCSALGCIHDRGLVHRDIKPGNVMLAADGRVLVADFGLAKDVASPDHTRPGMALGTLEYMSPEQRDNAMAVDARTDIYALGILLYELLTWQRPGVAASLAATALPFRRSLQQVYTKCCAQHVEDRYSSVAELEKDLQHILTRTAPRHSRRLAVCFGIAAAVSAALVVAAGLWWQMAGPPAGQTSANVEAPSLALISPRPQRPSPPGQTSAKDGASTFDSPAVPVDTSPPSDDTESFAVVAGIRMARREVTNREYLAFLEAKPEWRKDRIAPGFHDGDYLENWPAPDRLPEGLEEHPVTRVSWFAAQAYCRWAGGRLPTTHEWLSASHEGLSRYPWGDALPDRPPGNLAGEEHRDGYEGTAPVGAFPAGNTPEGIADLYGNAWEWCADENLEQRAFLGTSYLGLLEEGRGLFIPGWQDPAACAPDGGFRVCKEL